MTEHGDVGHWFVPNGRHIPTRNCLPFTVQLLNCEGIWLELEFHRAFQSSGVLRGAAVAQVIGGTSGAPV